jgi:RNA polymerase sigma-70 factor (ECF subfamily)
MVGQSRDQRFEALIDAHGIDIANYLRRRCFPLPQADVSDLVEETLIIVWRRLDELTDDALFPWTMGVARNVLRNAKRSSRRRNHYESSVRVQGPVAPAEEFVVANESIRSALMALGHREREILTLHFWDGLSVEEIGVSLSISSRAAAVALSRAQQHLRALMGEES